MSLIIEELNVCIGEKNILSNIHLEIKEGEFLSLLGPSGCGKSTLLKSIAGLIEVNCKSIAIDNRRIDRLPPNKRGTVIVFQDLRLFPNMTAIENVAFPLKMQKVPKKNRLKTAQELLKKVQLEGFDHRAISQMSGGQQQRVALARAMAGTPDILLLDEPFSSLDENLRAHMRTLILDLHREYHTTMVLVTHDQGEALMLSDRVALMLEGEIIQCDTPRTIYENPCSLEAAKYFGESDFLNGQVKDGIFHCGQLSFPVVHDDGNYNAMIRTSALSEREDGIPMKMMQSEYRGASCLLHLRCGEETLHMKSLFTVQRDLCSDIRIHIDERKVLLFPIS